MVRTAGGDIENGRLEIEIPVHMHGARLSKRRIDGPRVESGGRGGAHVLRLPKNESRCPLCLFDVSS